MYKFFNKGSNNHATEAPKKISINIKGVLQMCLEKKTKDGAKNTIK
jgi:hypothetical protein